MNEEELEKMELELEELKNASGGRKITERDKQLLIRYVRRWKSNGTSYEDARKFIDKELGQADAEVILKIVNDVYGK